MAPDRRPWITNIRTVHGHESVGKSGTWEIQVKEGGREVSRSGDTWFVGGIPQLAATVWIGGARDRVALKDKNDRDMFGSTVSAAIWEEFLETASEAMKWDEEKFPDPIPTGDDSKGNGTRPVVVPPPTSQDPNSGFCQIQPTNPQCLGGGNDDDDDDDDQNTGNNGNNGNTGIPGNNGGGNGGGGNG